MQTQRTRLSAMADTDPYGAAWEGIGGTGFYRLPASGRPGQSVTHNCRAVSGGVGSGWLHEGAEGRRCVDSPVIREFLKRIGNDESVEIVFM